MTTRRLRLARVAGAIGRTALVAAALTLTTQTAVAAPSDHLCALPDSGKGRPEGAGPLKRNGQRQVLPLAPRRVVKVGCRWPADVRAIVLTPGSIRLQSGGRVVRQISIGNGGAIHLDRIAQLVGSGKWLARGANGVIELRAPLVQRPGSRLAITAPRVRTVRLVDNRYVHLGGEGASVLIKGVTITSRARGESGPDTKPKNGRPFIFYENGSRLDIVNSTISFLGSDRSNGYGISWKNGSTGVVKHSTFERNFFGIYTNRARDIIFRDNTIRFNDLYGWDPHDFSTGLVFERNVVHGNGSHGIIVSNGVRNSVIRGNRSFDNEGNGIVIDKGSPRNLVEGNVVKRNADGIVLLDSPDNRVVANEVTGNQVGVRVNGKRSKRNVLRRNNLTDNQIGVQAYRGAARLNAAGTQISGGDIGMALDAPNSQVVDITVTGARLGIELRRPAVARRLNISGAEVGLRDDGMARKRNLSGLIAAEKVGIRQRGFAFPVGNAVTIDAPRPVVNEITLNEQPPSYLWWLPLAGMFFIASAVLIELLRSRREKGRAVRAARHARRLADGPTPDGLRR
ncbi:MAG: right-handed parallel beta-helix repeat-containing protein [Thermoleophilia bacterium]|nr:right-handed parallel beta-helix repeat-containing protein [Thermoleophilia bacterium]